MTMYTVKANCVVEKAFYIMARDYESALRKAKRGMIFHEEEEEMKQYDIGDCWETDEAVAHRVKAEVQR